MIMDLDRSFGFLVHDVARLFGRRFNQRALLFLGLTRAQCKVLGYLARNEGINQAGLADLLEIKPMTLVRQIDRILYVTTRNNDAPLAGSAILGSS